MLQEQRGHEIPLVERIEQIDGVKHGSFVRARQLLDERFDCRSVRDVGADGCGSNVARDDAGAKSSQCYSRHAINAIATQPAVTNRLA